jgi:hypothetical protein
MTSLGVKQAKDLKTAVSATDFKAQCLALLDRPTDYHHAQGVSGGSAASSAERRLEVAR